MIKKFIKENWQIIAIILFFIIVSAIYFQPTLSGYTLKQGDIASWKSASKELVDYRELYGEEGIWTNSMFGGMPGYFINYKYINGFTQIGTLLALGLPFTMLPISMLFISMISFFMLGKMLKINNLISVLGALAYGFVSYNILIIEAGHNTKMQAISYLPALLGAFIMAYKSRHWLLATALFSFFMGLELRAGHIQMTYYFSFILIFIGVYFLYKYIKNKELVRFFKRTGIIVIGIMLALLANFNNYYNNYDYSKYTMRGVPEITINPDGTKKITNQSLGLDRDYIVQWSYGKQETLNLLIPNAVGDSRNLTGDYFDYLREEKPSLYNYTVEQYQKSNGKVFGGYWGNQPFTSGANYIGAIIILFAIMYMVLVKTRLKWALISVSVLAILLSWGKNLGGSIEDMWLTNFFIDYIPLYSKFRVPASILTILNLLFPFMAILFLNHVYKNLGWAKDNLKRILVVGGVVSGFVLILAVFPSFLNYTSQTEDTVFGQLYQSYAQSPTQINPLDAETSIIEFRENAFRSDAFRTLIFILLAIVVLYLWIVKKIKFKTAIIGLSGLVLIDVWMIDKRYLNNEKNSNNKREYLSYEKVTGYENTPNATQGDYDIYNKEIAKKPQIEQEAQERIATHRSNKRRNNKKLEESVRFSSLNFNTNYRVLNLDNPFNSSSVAYFHKSSGGYHAAKMARYQDIIDFYIGEELSRLQTPEQAKVLNMLNTKYYLYQGNLVLDNPYVYGNAWFVSNVKKVNSPDEEILAIREIDPKNTAVVDQSMFKLPNKEKYDNSKTSTIVLEDYKPNHLIYSTKTNTEQLAVFSEVYFHDWQAYIDDSPVDHIRANYILRALPIPKGGHKVEFKYEPKMISVGNIIAICSFILILFSLVYGIFKYTKEIKTVVQPENNI